MGETRAWPKLGSIRVRTTIAGVVIVAVALLAGALALVAVLRSTLASQIEAAAFVRGREVAAVLESGAFGSELTVDDPEESLIQVVDSTGRVIDSSPNVAGLPAVAQLSPGDSAEATAPIDDEPFMVVAVGADAPEGELTVLVARSLEAPEESARVLTGLLVVGLPLLLAVTAATIWTVVGRTLAPVEAIRAEVEEISEAELHRRVPFPGGEDEVSRLAATMNRMLDRLEAAQARQRRFVSDASHELRSPVASIRQHAEVALAHPDSTDATELAEAVLADDLRVERLVDDLLVLARADEGMPAPLQAVDLDDLVFEEALRARSPRGAEILTTEVSAGRVQGDRSGLRRMVRNLIENAVRHAERRVSVSLTEDLDRVLLAVEDDGPGIPPEERTAVFERFVRLDQARAHDGGGAGLGLAIVAEVVATHGGTVAVGDGRLGGARIEVALRRLAD